MKTVAVDNLRGEVVISLDGEIIARLNPVDAVLFAEVVRFNAETAAQEQG